MYQYRLYESDIYVKDCYAESYDSAIKILNPTSSGKIFSVEDDGHEVECGDAWINDIFLELEDQD